MPPPRPALPQSEIAASFQSFRGIPPAVWLLGWASLLTDTASEAIYPLLPVFLTRVLGAGAFSLGLIEGMADAASSLLKIVSGRLSDRWGVRRPLVIAGYGLSGAVRPLIGFVTSWPQVLGLRFVDRVGKGTRDAPRDAMLAHLAGTRLRGRVFGLQRAMDHAGAVAGPLLAALFLVVYPGQYRPLFALTAIPGVIVVVLLFRVREVSDDPVRAVDQEQADSWRALPRSFFVYLAIILLFTLGNSTDAFLLLKLADAGVPAPWIPLLWSALHVIKVVFSLAGGTLADRWSRRGSVAIGWGVYAAVYGAFAASESATTIVAWFLLYGVYFGLTEGPERALVADLAPRTLRATAFGFYSAATGVGALTASLLFGGLWQVAGPGIAFTTGATLAGAAAILISVVRFSPAPSA